ncbi:MAG: histidinol-phosphate transaminase [Pyrinomonadaceae bacterium]
MTFDLDKIVRTNIKNLKPYSSARTEFGGSAEVFLDANENAFGSPAGNNYNRYPDPLQTLLKGHISEFNNIASSQIFVGNGSDEVIDLLIRIFCEPRRDEIIICSPTYGMYRVSAEINDVSVTEASLTDEFQLNVPAIFNAISERTKLIFICSPNNPTGNLMSRRDIVEIAKYFHGIVVVDEAYVHFAGEPSMINDLSKLPNLVVLQTFSKAWGMAGLRVGIAFASAEIVALLNRVKPPYNVSSIAQSAVWDAFDHSAKLTDWIAVINTERQKLSEALGKFEFVKKIYPSDANFILVKTDNADGIHQYLVNKKIIIRNRSRVALCEGCVRITIGTPDENDRLLEALDRFENSSEIANNV